MDNLGTFLIAVIVIALIAYVAIWAFSTDYFLDDVTTDFDVWRAVIAAVIFAVVLILLLYWAHSYGYMYMDN